MILSDILNKRMNMSLGLTLLICKMGLMFLGLSSLHSKDARGASTQLPWQTSAVLNYPPRDLLENE